MSGSEGGGVRKRERERGGGGMSEGGRERVEMDGGEDIFNDLDFS